MRTDSRLSVTRFAPGPTPPTGDRCCLCHGGSLRWWSVVRVGHDVTSTTRPYGSRERRMVARPAANAEAPTAPGEPTGQRDKGTGTFDSGGLALRQAGLLFGGVVMLEFDAATKRFGRARRLTGARSRPGRGLTGFLGPNGAGKTTAMRAVFGLVELDAGAVRWRGARHRLADAFRLHARGTGPVPPHGRARSTRLLGRLCGRTGREAVGASTVARAARSRRPSERPPRLPLPRQPAACPTHRGARQRTGAAGARRAVLGPGPIAIGAMGTMLSELASAGTTVLFSSHQLDLVEDLCDDVVIIDHGHVVTTGDSPTCGLPCRTGSSTSSTRGSSRTGRRCLPGGDRGGRRPGQAARSQRRRPGGGGDDHQSRHRGDLLRLSTADAL